MVVNITCIISLIYMLGGFTISILQILIDLILEQFYNEDTLIIIVLQMRKLNHREGKQISQGHTACKWWSHDLNPGNLALESVENLQELTKNSGKNYSRGL